MTGTGLRGQVTRYLLVGGINTLLTYALFVGLGLVIPAGIAFTIAYAAGLVWVVFGSSRIVFKARYEVKRLAFFAAWYLFVYGIGQLVVQVISPRGIQALLWTSLVVLLITTPITFWGGRYIFGNRRGRAVANEKN